MRGAVGVGVWRSIAPGARRERKNIRAGGWKTRTHPPTNGALSRATIELGIPHGVARALGRGGYGAGVRTDPAGARIRRGVDRSNAPCRLR